MGKSPGVEDKNGVKKGPWTAEEDQKLKDYIQKHGYGKWRTLPKNAGLKRCGKSCRLRWTNYLRPDIKRGKFSAEEEETIIQLHRVWGNKWSAIAARLPRRTDNEIKNYWNTHIKKKLLRMGIDPVTHNPQLNLLQLCSILNSSLYGSSSSQSHQFHPSNNFLDMSSLCNPDILNLATTLLSNIQNHTNQSQSQNQYPSFVTPNSEFLNQTQFMEPNLHQLSSTPTNFLLNYHDHHHQENLADQNQVYFPANNVGENIFKNSSFNSILSSSTPSSSSTPLNSSSTLTNMNGSNNEDERDTYCSNNMLFDMSDGLDVITNGFM